MTDDKNDEAAAEAFERMVIAVLRRPAVQDELRRLLGPDLRQATAAAFTDVLSMQQRGAPCMRRAGF